MRIRRAVLALMLVAVLAHAEGSGFRQKLASSADHIYGADTLMPLPRGGWVSFGGANLRRLKPGGRNWETIYRIPRDSLYRVDVDDAGRLLAVWEKDPLIHLFSADGKQHRTFSRPTVEGATDSAVNELKFMRGGKEALVVVGSVVPRERSPQVVYRLPLDGSPPQELYRVESGLTLLVTRDYAIYEIPKRPGQVCEMRTCDPVSVVLAYQWGEGGVTWKILFDGRQTPLDNALTVFPPPFSRRDGDPVVLELHFPKNERALLRWRPGDGNPVVRPLVKHGFLEKLVATRSGDVLQVVDVDRNLELRRYPADGAVPQLTSLPNPYPGQRRETGVHALGERKNGDLYLHWGDELVLIPRNGHPSSYSLEPLMNRGNEWADADIYREDSEELWVGMEFKGGRDFARVHLADVVRKAKPFSPAPSRASNEQP